MGNDPRWNAAGTRVHVGGSVVEFQRWLARHDAEVLRSAALDAESDADSDDHDPTTMRVCRAWSQWLKDRADRVEQGRQAAAAPVPDAEDDTLREQLAEVLTDALDEVVHYADPVIERAVDALLASFAEHSTTRFEWGIRNHDGYVGVYASELSARQSYEQQCDHMFPPQGLIRRTVTTLYTEWEAVEDA